MEPVGRHKDVQIKRKCSVDSYKASCLATDGGESMDGLDYGTKGVDQFAMFVPIAVECGFSF